jgi:hypothetical protein
MVGIEGPGWIARDFDRLWADPGMRERILQCATRVEHETTLLGASAHIMAIGKK